MSEVFNADVLDAINRALSAENVVTREGEEPVYCNVNNETREIEIPGEITIFGVEHDENAVRVFFKCPKIIGDNVDIDITQSMVYIIYINAGGEKDQYIVTDVNETEDGNVTFSWLINRKPAKYQGITQFGIRVIKSKTGGEIENEWNTTVANANILNGVETEDIELSGDNIDVVNQLLDLTKQEIELTKQNSIEEIEQKGQETLDSIPDDYTQLQADVDGLNNFQNMIIDKSLLFETSEYSNFINRITTRMFLNYNNPISKNTFILDIQLYLKQVSSRSAKYKIEFWKMETDKLTLQDSFYIDIGNAENLGEWKTYTVNKRFEFETIISINAISVAGNTAFYMGQRKNTTMFYMSDTAEYETIQRNQILTNENNYTAANVIRIGHYIEYEKIYNIIDNFNSRVTSLEKHSHTILVDQIGYGDFTSIIEACSNISERDEIVVNDGVYIGSIKQRNKYIKMRGVNKNTCIVKSNDGRYSYPPAEFCAGYFENLTFFHEYVEGESYMNPSNPSESGGYAIHVEGDFSSGKKLTFVNCDFISDFYPAVGIGLRKDFTLEFINCRFYSNTNKMYTSQGLTDYGCLYFHDSAADMICGDNQKIICKNCEFYSVGDILISIQAKKFDESNKMYAQFVGCMGWSNTKENSDETILDIIQTEEGNWSGKNCSLLPSFGNNISRLNTKQ